MTFDKATADKAIEAVRVLGYAHLPGFYPQDVIAKIIEKVDVLYSAVEAESGKQSFFSRLENMGNKTLQNIQNKDFYFLEVLFSSPFLQGILMELLNDRWYTAIPASDPNYILKSFSARSSVSELPLHIDSYIPYLGGDVISLQHVVVLEDMSPENGCTVVVPGSHLAGRYTRPDDRHMAIPLSAKAGDLILWDSRLWHGTAANPSGGSRWVLVATYARWWLKQLFDIPGTLPSDYYNRLTDSQKAVMGYCSMSIGDESFGVGLKRGYDALSVR